MNPTEPTPTPADHQPVTDVARRVGPPLAVVSLVVTAALLAWLALAPTAIAGPLEEAPFTVPAMLVVPPDDDGCLRVVEGDGASTEHCIDELTRADNRDRYVHTDAWFDDEGRLVAVHEDDEGQRVLHVDLATGKVLEVLEETSFPELDDAHPAPGDRPVETPTEGSPPDEPPPSQFVYTDGDRVVRADEERWETESGEVLLDLHGPPGYRLGQAAVSPDDAWVVVVTGRGEVVIAPMDASAAPYVWAEVPDDRWLDLTRGIRWDG